MSGVCKPINILCSSAGILSSSKRKKERKKQTNKNKQRNKTHKKNKIKQMKKKKTHKETKKKPYTHWKDCTALSARASLYTSTWYYTGSCMHNHNGMWALKIPLKSESYQQHWAKHTFRMRQEVRLWCSDLPCFVNRGKFCAFIWPGTAIKVWNKA